MFLGKAMIHARKPKANAQGRALPKEPVEPHEGWPGQRFSLPTPCKSRCWCWTIVRTDQYLRCSPGADPGAQGRGQDGRGAGCDFAFRVAAHSHAFGHSPAGISPHSASDARPLAKEHPAARSQQLPILRSGSARRRTYTGSRYAPFARRLSTWENLVACCHSCNRRKGNHLLSEISDIKLMREPRPFSLHTSRHIMRMIGHSDHKWRKYLYY